MKAVHFCLVCWIALSVSAGAATSIYHSDFSNSGSGANSIDGWVYVGGVGGQTARYSGSFDNFDTAAPVGDGSGPYGGDGVKGDGAIRFDTGDAIAGNEMWTYTLSVLLGDGDMLNLIGSAFNVGSTSNANFTVTLYNVTDSRQLVSSGNLGGVTQGNVGDDINPFYDFNVNYTALAADAGDTIEIRVLENHNSVNRDGYLDYVQVTYQAVPEPSRWMLGAGGLAAMILRRRRR